MKWLVLMAIAMAGALFVANNAHAAAPARNEVAAGSGLMRP